VRASTPQVLRAQPFRDLATHVNRWHQSSAGVIGSRYSRVTPWPLLSHGVQMLDQGMVIEEGPPEQVFGAPVHERTRRFLRRLAWEDQAI
jgi:hypothetical protein